HRRLGDLGADAVARDQGRAVVHAAILRPVARVGDHRRRPWARLEPGRWLAQPRRALKPRLHRQNRRRPELAGRPPCVIEPPRSCPKPVVRPRSPRVMRKFTPYFAVPVVLGIALGMMGCPTAPKPDLDDSAEKADLPRIPPDFEVKDS